MSVASAYTKLCSHFHNFYRCLWRSSYGQYAIYGGYLMRTYTPKIAYENSFEDEYTQPTVKYNYLIVFGLFTGTFIYTRNQRRNIITENQTKLRTALTYGKYSSF